MTKTILLLAFGALTTCLTVPKRLEAQVAGFQLVATSVTDGDNYRVYFYELTNHITSAWAIGGLKLYIPASRGAPENLPVTGELRDFTRTGGTVAPHAQVGSISPPGWRAILSRSATLRWAPHSTRWTSGDSIAPAEAKDGFGIRSSYLPGITEVEVLPTMESCCQEPSDTSGGEDIYPLPSSYRVSGFTIAPRYLPDEVDIELLRSQVVRICSDRLWIDDPGLCSEMRRAADDAAVRVAAGDQAGAIVQIDRLRTLAEENREPRGPVRHNAYWLLELNGEHVARQLRAG